MSVSRRWDSSPSQRVLIEKAPAGTMFEDINGNIGAVTRHSKRLTWPGCICTRDSHPTAKARNEVFPLRDPIRIPRSRPAMPTVPRCCL